MTTITDQQHIVVANTHDDKRRAMRDDATRRLRELRKVRAVLWPDRDDPEVLSELVTVQSEIRAAEAARLDGRQ